MAIKKGRLLDHVQLRVADLEVSRTFYRAALTALGIDRFHEDPDCFVADELWLTRADGPVSRVHLAFQAASED